MGGVFTLTFLSTVKTFQLKPAPSHCVSLSRTCCRYRSRTSFSENILEVHHFIRLQKGLTHDTWAVSLSHSH